MKNYTALVKFILMCTLFMKIIVIVITVTKIFTALAVDEVVQYTMISALDTFTCILLLFFIDQINTHD